MNVWVEAPPNESPQALLDRLVLHGLRCGKSTLVSLGFHAGEHGYNDDSRKRISDALGRLQRRGKAAQGPGGWRAV